MSMRRWKAILKARPSVAERFTDEQTPRERAEFLAYEIMADVLATEDEIADAIEQEILRFANARDPRVITDRTTVRDFADYISRP